MIISHSSPVVPQIIVMTHLLPRRFKHPQTGPTQTKAHKQHANLTNPPSGPLRPLPSSPSGWMGQKAGAWLQGRQMRLLAEQLPPRPGAKKKMSVLKACVSALPETNGKTRKHKGNKARETKGKLRGKQGK